jgi:acyl dehydratase
MAKVQRRLSLDTIESNIRVPGAHAVSDRYFEDFKLGERFVSAGMTITEAGIMEFARQWDPQPFHIDAEFAQKWQYGGVIASGLHTMAVSLRLWLDLGVFRACSLGSPGLGETQFPRPVRPGDTLRVVTDIVELRVSASKPDRGVCRLRQVTINQRGEHVMEQETTVFLKRRPLALAGATR